MKTFIVLFKEGGYTEITGTDILNALLNCSIIMRTIKSVEEK